MAAPALSEAPPHGICCHLHKNGNNIFNKDQAFKPQEAVPVKVPLSRFPFTFSPNPGRWLLCVAESPGIPSCYLYEIVKVQVRAFSF